MLVAKHVCLSVYVSFSMTRRGFSNIHAYANLHFLICLWWLSVYVWACMFSFPWQVEGFQTYMHARHIFIFVSTSDFERVCLSAHRLVFDDRQRVFKHTYIHAYFVDFEAFPWLILLKRVCLKLLTARWTGGSDSLRKTFSILTFNAVFWDLWGVVLLEAPHIHTCVRQISHKCYHKSKDQTCMCLKPLSLSANTKHTHPNIHAKILPTAPT